MISSPMLLLNFVLKVSPADISKRLIESEIGNIRSPYPNAPPVDFNVTKLNGKK
jgi:hypothetical protein